MSNTSYRYTDSHEWVENEGDVRKIGITDHAQSMMGDIVHTELPEVGTTFEKGDIMVTIESPKAAAEVYAPIGGEVVEVNSSLESEPEIINKDPYGNGWIIKIKPQDPSATNSLLTFDDYKKTIGE